MAKLVSAEEDIPNLFKYLLTIKSVYFTLLKVGKKYNKSFSLSQFPIVEVGSGQCFSTVTILDNDVEDRLDIYTRLPKSRFESYDLEILRTFKRGVQSLEDAYRVISYAAAEKFKYKFDVHNMNVYIESKINTKYSSLESINWEEVMSFEKELDLISKF